MTYEAIVATILSIIHPQYQELGLINRLNNVLSFDHNIFLVHSTVDINRYVNAKNGHSSTPQSIYTFKNSDDNIMEFKTFGDIPGKNKLLILVPESSNLQSNLRVLTFVKKIQFFHVNMKIGVFFSQIATRDDISTLFEWCWSQRIINIFVAFYSNSEVNQRDERTNIESLLNIFNFNPFGRFDVLNVTESESIHNIFHGKNLNFQGHPLRLAVIDDFSISQYYTNVQYFGGADEELWNAVFAALNASYSVYWVRKKLEPLEMLDNGTVDIHVDLTQLTQQRIVTLCPMIIENLVMVMPKALPYPAIVAYFRKMSSDGCFVYFVVLLVGVMYLLTICRYIKCNKILIFQCAAEVVNLLMNDNQAIIYQQLTRSEICLIIPMTFTGFFMANGFLSNLKSHITKPILQPDIDTVEELYMSSLPIFAPNDYWWKEQMRFLQNISTYKDWHKKVTNKNKPLISLIIAETSFSYLEYGSIAKEVCRRRPYHIAKIPLQSIWFGYNVRYDFPFTERVNEVILRTQATGLYDQWWVRVKQKQLYKSQVAKEAQFESFTVPTFIVYGWFVGVIVLVIEIIWTKFKYLFTCRLQNLCKFVK